MSNNSNRWDHNNQSQRSFLANAGQRSLYTNLNSPIQPTKSQQMLINSPIQPQEQKTAPMDKRTRQLIIKLTLPRLRKMQALVRGFLVRRKVYPALLEEYLVAKSLMNLVISNVVYRESSDTILQSITYIKYAGDREQLTMGLQKRIQNDICDGVLHRVFLREIENIVELAVAEHAKLLTRPKITYGFNLRDPLQLLLFDLLNRFVILNHREIVREAINQCAHEGRELRLIDEWIDQYGMVPRILEEVVEEALNESMAEYIVQNMINRLSSQGAQVVARGCLEDAKIQRQQKAYEQIDDKVIEWLLQECALGAIVDLGHSITK